MRGYRLLREAGVDDFRITALCDIREDDARMYAKRGEGPAQRPPVSKMPGDPLAVDQGELLTTGRFGQRTPMEPH